MEQGVAIDVTVPYQNRPLEPPSRDRIRRLRRHLIEALRDLRLARHPDRLIQPRPAEPNLAVSNVLQAACTACQGHCCLGGGEHAYLDERTMARVRRNHPDLEAGAIIAAYVRHVAPLSYAGSCLFHGQSGCTLYPSLRADLCHRYYCDGLTAFLRRYPSPSKVNVRATQPLGASARTSRKHRQALPLYRNQTDI